MTNYALDDAAVRSALVATSGGIFGLRLARSLMSGALAQASQAVAKDFTAAGASLNTFQTEHETDIDTVEAYARSCVGAVVTCLNIYAAAENEMGSQTDAMNKIAQQARLRDIVAFDPGFGSGNLESSLSKSWSKDHGDSKNQVKGEWESGVKVDQIGAQTGVTATQTSSWLVGGNGSSVTNTQVFINQGETSGSGDFKQTTDYAGSTTVTMVDAQWEVANSDVQMTGKAAGTTVKVGKSDVLVVGEVIGTTVKVEKN